MKKEFFNYSEIQELREEAWKNPQVKKNWEEYNKKMDAHKKRLKSKEGTKKNEK